MRKSGERALAQLPALEVKSLGALFLSLSWC